MTRRQSPASASLRLAGVCAAALLLATRSAFAHQNYQSDIPNGNNIYDREGVSWPAVGHLARGGGGERNPFGLAFAAAGYKWTEALCRGDADGDGLTNGYELGDPDCVWVKGGPPPVRTTGLSHPGFPGDSVPGILDTCRGAPPLPADHYNITMQFSTPYVIPSAETTYYPMQAFDIRTLPGSADADHMFVRVEPILSNPEVVHHMLVYACTEAEAAAWLNAPRVDGGVPCSQGLVWAWALGAPPYCFPSGMMAKLRASAPFILLEVHVNNQQKTPDLAIQPGFKFTAVPSATLGASVIQTDWIWVMVPLSSIRIPPRTKRTEIVGKIDIPDNLGAVDVKVIGTMSHAHYIGKQVWLEARNPSSNYGNRNIACNPNYDNEYQEVTPVAHPYATLSNTDTLYLHGVFDSSERDFETVGGEASSDEMLLAFLLYYPSLGTLRFAAKPDDVATSTDGTALPTATTCMASALGSGTPPPSTQAPFVPRVPGWVVAHSVLAALSIGLLMPIGTLMPAVQAWRNLGDTTWFQTHRGLVMGGLLIGIIAFIVALASVSSKLYSVHGKLGVSFVVLAVVQGFVGALRPHLPKGDEAKSRARQVFEVVHPLLGHSLMVIAAAEIWLGYDRLYLVYVPFEYVKILGWVHAAGIFGLWAIALVLLKFGVVGGTKKQLANVV